MLIQFERRGGFAGLRKTFIIDTETFSMEESRRINDLVESSDFFNLQAKYPVPRTGADYFIYTLTVEKEGKKHTVEVCDPSLPVSLRPLVQYLMKISWK